MGNKNHILDFTSKAASVGEKSQTRPLPALIEQVCSVGSQALDKNLRKMFEQADDCLFDMSDSGYNNAHFDAMRMLRLKKSGLLDSFQQALKLCFSENIGKFNQQNNDIYESDESMSFENIALVQDSELEEGIAIDSMVKKAHNVNAEALELIRIRLDTLTSTHAITQENNPFEPAFICSAFKTASLTLDIDIESLLVIYKLFERVVIAELADTYEQINQFFINKGVLPELKTNKKPMKASSASVPNRTQSSRVSKDSLNNELTQDATQLDEQQLTKQQHAGEQMLFMMQSLLANSRGETVSNNQQQLPEVDTASLLGALTNLQLTSSPPNHVTTDLRHHLNTNTTELQSSALGQYNEDMIDIVSMLFDFILDDKNLHIEIKPIISRLQIPMLKVGLVDRTFFSNKNHPARKLLNEIARVGISWDPKDIEAQKIREKIEFLCTEITTNFKDDISIFNILLEDFSLFREKIEHRANIFERRTCEAEEGKAKAESARGAVNQELEKICRDKKIPDSVRLIFKNAWINVLFLEKLKESNDGWERASKVAQLLIWSVQPVNRAQGLEKLISRIPILIKNLRKGFDIVSLSPVDVTHLLEQLEETHCSIIKRAQALIEENNKEDILRLEPAPLIPSDTNEPSVVDKEQVDSISTKVESITEYEQVEIHDIGFNSEQLGCLSTDEKPKLDLKRESFQVIKNLRAGIWVQLDIDGNPVRCKLAAKILSTGKFIFVSRLGVKIAEFLTNDLVAEYQSDRLKIIDDEALFDRALESVISNLRAMKSEV